MGPEIIILGYFLMVVFTTSIIFFFRTKPFMGIFQGYRFWWALPATILVCMFAASVIGRKCGVEGPEPESPMGWVWASCILCLILFVNKKDILIPCCLFVLGLGILLEHQFDVLVYQSDDYYAIDKKSNNLMPKGCSHDANSTNIVAIKLWHSRFSGIYKAKRAVTTGFTK